jgi:hypothetical protein
MNERLKELSYEAGLFWQFSPAYEKCLERFAELVRADERELAKPEQEPIGWFLKDHLETYMESYKDIEGAIPLYTSPPRKEWVGLTDDECIKLIDEIQISSGDYELLIARAIELLLRNKNHG